MPLILLRLGEGRRWDKVCEDLGEGAGDAELIPARPPVEGLRQLRSVIQDPGNCVCVSGCWYKYDEGAKDSRGTGRQWKEKEE